MKQRDLRKVYFSYPYCQSKVFNSLEVAVIAIAKASETSSITLRVGSFKVNRTILATAFLLASPYPATALFTSLGVNSLIGRFLSSADKIITPRASETSKAVFWFLEKKTFSTARDSGLNFSIKKLTWFLISNRFFGRTRRLASISFNLFPVFSM